MYHSNHMFNVPGSPGFRSNCCLMFGSTWFLQRNTKILMHVCVSMSIFCNKTLFNTCVSLGIVQLKSNTLQESITCWVYWQRTELKWPTKRGQGVSFEAHGNKMKANMIAEIALQANVNIFQMRWQAASVKTAVSSASQIFKRYKHRWRFLWAGSRRSSSEVTKRGWLRRSDTNSSWSRCLSFMSGANNWTQRRRRSSKAVEFPHHRKV